MNQPQNTSLSIDMELVRIRSALPKFIADLSRTDKESAISFIRDWGDGRKPIRQIYNEVLDKLDAATS